MTHKPDHETANEAVVAELLEKSCQSVPANEAFRRQLLEATMAEVASSTDEAEADEQVMARPTANVVPVRWLRLVAVSACLAIVACGLSFALFQPKYVATSLLRVNAGDYLAFPSKPSAETRSRLVRMPVSKAVLARVASRSRAAMKAAGTSVPATVEKWLLRHIRASWVAESDFIQVKCQSGDAELSAQIATDVAQMLQQLTTVDETKQLLVSSLQIEAQRWRKELQRQRNDIRKRAQNATGMDPFNPYRPQVIESTSNGQKVVRLRLGQDDTKARSKLVELQERLVRVELSISGINAWLNARNVPQSSLRLPADLLVAPQRKLPLTEEARKSLQAERKALVAKRELVEQEWKTLLGDFDDMSGEILELEFARSELMATQSIIDQLANRIVQLSTETARPTAIQVFAEATVPELKTSRVSVVAWSTMGTFIAAFGFLLLSRRNRKRSTPRGQFSLKSLLLVWLTTALVTCYWA